ncbi:MAG: hypothetical protein ACI406_11805, partial [Victivallis vadensis]
SPKKTREICGKTVSRPFVPLFFAPSGEAVYVSLPLKIHDLLQLPIDIFIEMYYNYRQVL